MQSPSKELLKFAADTTFEDLPKSVVVETKRLILDSIGVAVAGLKTEKGRLGVALARKLGGAPESTILGTGEKFSSSGAAFANGELMNAMDYDAFIFPTHCPPAVIPAPLALAETVNAAGRDVILAVALGCEISYRLGTAIRGRSKILTRPGQKEMGRLAGTRYLVSVGGVSVLAGAIGAARIKKLFPEKVSNLIGLAAHFTPLPSSKWHLAKPSMPKYLCNGWASMAEVVAILLAEMDYGADTEALDGDLGYWRFFGSEGWEPEALLDGLGSIWNFPENIEYKPYPCCLTPQVMLDCYLSIVEKNTLKPEEIDSVLVKGSPVLAEPLHTAPVVDHVAAQFNSAYLLAAATFCTSLVDWQEEHTLNDPKILKFMERVRIEAHPGYREELLKDRHSNLTVVEVKARGKVFSQEGRFAGLAPTFEASRMAERDLISKFRNNVCGIMSDNSIAKSIALIMNLDKMEGVSQLFELVKPSIH